MVKDRLDPEAEAITLHPNNFSAKRRNAGVLQENLADLARLVRSFVGAFGRGERKVSLTNFEKKITEMLTDLLSFLLFEIPPRK